MPNLASEITRVAGGAQLRLRREYPSDVEDVWSAITEPERLGRWLGTIDLIGGAGRLVLGDGEDEYADIVVTECTRPRRIVLDWTYAGASTTRLLVTLTRDPSGRTSAVLEHTFPATEPARLAGQGCGWEHYVDSLAAHLAGESLPDFADYYPAKLDQWRAVAAR
ncbi:SRPBCC domain-containing protein [Rugosimonospora africana]|uniref:ATPase n=1 Tax=Rugosimonospora africana TaxID=556532 RepID=A0A8J3VU36_9ACTN|nr:SRPBCC domain-containing protein [Rugosimonospora africana]GIH19077.1 ATPase [Rugosimonospora africana]